MRSTLRLTLLASLSTLPFAAPAVAQDSADGAAQDEPVIIVTGTASTTR